MKKGERYVIRNATLSGEPVIEGAATLVSPVAGARDIQRWEVRFDGENETVPRFVRAEDKIPAKKREGTT